MPRARNPPLWLLITLTGSTQFLNVANISSVNIALPDLATDLGVEESTLPWVVSAYLVTFAGFLMVSGRVADLFGRRRVLAAGFAIFAVCAVLNTVAPTMELLIASRAVQGVGSAATIPAALGILTSTVTEPRARGRALAAFGAAGAVGFVSGLVLGGMVTGPLGWRWVFGLTVAPAVLLLAGVLRWAPADRPGSRATGRVDVLGAVTATGGLVALVYALTRAGRAGWTDLATLGALAGGLALLGCFALVQFRVQDPLVPPVLWRRPNLSAAVLVGFCNFAAWVGGNYFLSLTLQRVLGYTSVRAAFALVPMAIGGFVFATLAGRLLPRTGGRSLLLIGLSGYLLGFVVLSTLGPDSGYLSHVLVGVVLTVAGSSLTYVASNVVAVADAAPDEQSLVGGLFNAGMQVGGGLGLAVMGAAAAARVPAGAQGPALLPGYQAAFWTAIGFAAAGLVTTVLGVSGRRVDDTRTTSTR